MLNFYPDSDILLCMISLSLRQAAEDVLKAATYADQVDVDTLMYQQSVMRTFIKVLSSADRMKEPQKSEWLAHIEKGYFSSNSDHMPTKMKELLDLARSIFQSCEN